MFPPPPSCPYTCSCSSYFCLFYLYRVLHVSRCYTKEEDLIGALLFEFELAVFKYPRPSFWIRWVDYCYVVSLCPIGSLLYRLTVSVPGRFMICIHSCTFLCVAAMHYPLNLLISRHCIGTISSQKVTSWLPEIRFPIQSLEYLIKCL